jgi:hypothetical protein
LSLVPTNWFKNNKYNLLGIVSNLSLNKSDKNWTNAKNVGLGINTTNKCPEGMLFLLA